MNNLRSDRFRREFYDAHPSERLALIGDIATRCYKAWDTWDIGPGPHGVQLAYLFATIAIGPGNWSFTLEMVNDEPNPIPAPLAQALQELFPTDHAIWLYVDREWNGLPESACPVCSHDCEGGFPKRVCRECGFDESKHNYKTYRPDYEQ